MSLLIQPILAAMNVFQISQALPSYFWENLLISIVGAIIGSGGAILVFYLTIRHDRRKEQEKQRSHYKDKLRYYHSLVSSVINSIEKQIQNEREYVVKVRLDPFEYNYLYIVINEDITRISERIDQEDIYHAFLIIVGHGQGETEILQSLNLIDYLHAALSSTKDSLFQTANYSNELEKKYVQISESILDEAGHKLNEIKINEPTSFSTNDFYNFLNTSILTYYTAIEDQQTIPLREMKFIRPFKLSLITNFRAIPISDKWLTLCKDCTHIYSEISTRYLQLANDIERDANDMEGRLPLLRRINDTINTALQVGESHL